MLPNLLFLNGKHPSRCVLRMTHSKYSNCFRAEFKSGKSRFYSYRCSAGTDAKHATHILYLLQTIMEQNHPTETATVLFLHFIPIRYSSTTQALTLH